MVRSAQLIPQCHQLAEAVARADQRERDVVAPHLVNHDSGRSHYDVDTVLRSHHADVSGEKPPPAPEFRFPGPRLSLPGSGPVRTTVTSAGALPLRVMATSR